MSKSAPEASFVEGGIKPGQTHTQRQIRRPAMSGTWCSSRSPAKGGSRR
jgi:hypothetical protein